MITKTYIQRGKDPWITVRDVSRKQLSDATKAIVNERMDSTKTITENYTLKSSSGTEHNNDMTYNDGRKINIRYNHLLTAHFKTNIV
jgi:hypothetical protein